jgi:hypothetical protein
MKYRKRTDGSLTTKSQLIAENPDTSLPKTWTAATLDFLKVDPVLASPKPTLGEFEVAVAAAPVLVEGSWMEAWTVQPMFVEYTEEVDTDGVKTVKIVTVAEQEAAYTESKLTKMRGGMVISMRQCRLALLGAGLLDSVDVAIAALPEPDKSAALVAWEYSHSVERLSDFVVSMGPLLGLTDLEVDALFEQAVEL